MKNDGGPAFPRPNSTDEHSQPCNVSYAEDGMSLRDWFAGKALQGILAVPDVDSQSIPGKEGDVLEISDWVEYLPQVAYDYADAMLVARERKR